jgi:hypothetical protein
MFFYGVFGGKAVNVYPWTTAFLIDEHLSITPPTVMCHEPVMSWVPLNSSTRSKP